MKVFVEKRKLDVTDKTLLPESEASVLLGDLAGWCGCHCLVCVGLAGANDGALVGGQ